MVIMPSNWYTRKFLLHVLKKTSVYACYTWRSALHTNVHLHVYIHVVRSADSGTRPETLTLRVTHGSLLVALAQPPATTH